MFGVEDSCYIPLMYLGKSLDVFGMFSLMCLGIFHVISLDVFVDLVRNQEVYYTITS